GEGCENGPVTGRPATATQPPHIPRQLVPPCPARTVHRTSSAPRYESAREDGMGGGAGAGCGRGRGGKVRARARRQGAGAREGCENGPVTGRPATATQPPYIRRQLVPLCPARTVHRTSSAPRYELADAPGGGYAKCAGRVASLVSRSSASGSERVAASGAPD